MLLAKPEILKLIKEKEVKVIPYTKSNIGPTSIDLTLGNEIRVFKKNMDSIDLSRKIDYKTITKTIKLTKKGYTLQPNEFILGITKERICLPNHIAGWLQGRSSYARYGLTVHSTASLVHPGCNNKQVLEIKNQSNASLILKPGLKLCQLALEEVKGKAKYKGKFQNQKKIYL